METKPKKANAEVDLIALAINSNSSIETIERLMALKEDYDEKQARKSFYEAFSQFQHACPNIERNKGASFNSKGGNVSYKYASLDEITNVIKDELFENRLSFRWAISQTDTKINVKCIVTHVDGHSIETHMEGAADTSGTKNQIQSNGSTITYLQRYTLLGCLGLTAQSDLDGIGGPENPKDDWAEHLSNITSITDLEEFWNQNKGLQKDKNFAVKVSMKKKQIRQNKR